MRSDNGNGSYDCNFLAQDIHLNNKTELENQLKKINAIGFYPYLTDKKEAEHLRSNQDDVMKIFHLRPQDVPGDIVERYQNQWIKAKVAIRVGNSFTQTEGGQLPVDKSDEVTSFPVHGHHFNLKFLDGKWDGRKHLFDRRNFTFPTGLLERVLTVLRQESLGYEVEDLREHAGEEIEELIGFR